MKHRISNLRTPRSLRCRQTNRNGKDRVAELAARVNPSDYCRRMMTVWLRAVVAQSTDGCPPSSRCQGAPRGFSPCFWGYAPPPRFPAAAHALWKRLPRYRSLVISTKLHWKRLTHNVFGAPVKLLPLLLQTDDIAIDGVYDFEYVVRSGQSGC